MKIIIRGNAVAQGRPRFSSKGGFARAYDPSKSRNWKADVKMQAIMQNVKIMEGPLLLKVDFYLMRPKSLPKKVTHHIKRPDLSNLIKGIEDALNGIAWNDDSQICETYQRKLYTTNNPGVEIDVISLRE